jgi:hypothetical protein
VIPVLEPASVSFDRIFVAGFPRQMTELALRDAIAGAGFPVREVEFVLDRVTGLRRGFAFVLLESKIEPGAAGLSLNRLRTATVEGRVLDVQAVGAPRWCLGAPIASDARHL